MTDEFVVLKDELKYKTTIYECCKAWISHREERHQNKMIRNTAIMNNKIAINHFTDWLKLNTYLNRKISTITVIDKFLGYKSNKLNWSKLTYNAYRTDLNTFFNYLRKLKVITENPVTESEKKHQTR